MKSFTKLSIAKETITIGVCETTKEIAQLETFIQK